MIEIINTSSVSLSANHPASTIAINCANAASASPLSTGGNRPGAPSFASAKGGGRISLETNEAPASTLRAAFLRAVREEIKSGAYETPQRLAGTLDRLQNVLA